MEGRGGFRRSRAVRVAGIVTACVITLVLVLAPVVALAAWVIDDRRVVSEVRLDTALQTFRPTDHPGREDVVPLAELDPTVLVKSDPSTCTPLTVLGYDGVVGASSWTGVNGRPLQPVRLLTLRYVDVAAARAALAEKRRVLRTCTTVRLSFPPFRAPAETYAVEAGGPTSWRPSRVAYALTGTERYEFYVRRFGNTLTWSFGDRDGAAARAAVVDDLAVRLAELSSG